MRSPISWSATPRRSPCSRALDVGKPIKDALAIDIPQAIRTLRYYAEALDKVYGEVGPETSDRFSFAVHEPLGVVGAIVPWNFPLHMAMWKVAPALAMGNSVVLKPAEQSPMTALKLGQLALEAGLPAGVLNVVPGFGANAGKALALHMDVDMIAFTGSGAVGRLLMQYSGQSNLKRISLELGGKSPQIVFADCPDLDAAAFHAAWGIFFNQGEVCTAASRLLVHESIADAFLDKLLAVAKAIVPGDPLEPNDQFRRHGVGRADAHRLALYRGRGPRGCCAPARRQARAGRHAAASSSSRPCSTR